MKKGRKLRTPKGAIILSDSSQEELEGSAGEGEEESPLPKNDERGCKGGEGGEGGDEELDMMEFEKSSECGDGGEVVEGGEGVVPGAVLQGAAEREMEEMEVEKMEVEVERVKCVRAVTEMCANALQGAYAYIVHKCTCGVTCAVLYCVQSSYEQ